MAENSVPRRAGSAVRLPRIAVGVVLGVAVLALLCPGLPQVYLSRNARATPGRLAPEIQSTGWINTPPPQPAGLRGKVVLVEFWTFG